MNERLLNYIESSFLSPLLDKEGITDISYNGKSIFYMHNINGRKKSDIEITNNEVLDFLRQIANYAERQFSYTTPFLDISVGRYRINAVHPSICRVNNEKSCSFAIRIGSEKLLITDDFKFIDEECRKYLFKALENEQSIVIAGATGSGKTELQKYLLSNLKDNSRVIVIDNIEELENVRFNDQIDLTSWLVSPNNTTATISQLIKNALRSNPDWLVIAESLGSEMADILQSVTTGHPIITTIHSYSLESIPVRMAHMIESTNVSQKYDDILSDIKSFIKVYVFLKRKINDDGTVFRYVDKIGEIDENNQMKIIYKRTKKV